ncbi:MAG: MtrB/PioB family outer membrane beta-barrel protein, partial [Rhodoferax sp.]
AAVAGLGATGAVQSNIAKAIADKLATLPETELSLVRRKGGARYDATLTDNWKAYASYSLEQRNGARPFAMNEGNISTEIAEPIDYSTHELLTGLQYADRLTQANLRASMSVFRNNIGTLNVESPFLNSALPFGAMQSATFDLYPDNTAYNLKGEFARTLPDFYKGRFNASLAIGSSLQDDALLAPISPVQSAQLAAAGVSTLGGSGNAGYASGTALVSNWNTTAALSQLTAKQRIDTSLLDLGLSLRPTEAFSVKGAARVFDSSNKGGYTAYNPLTGQFGRGIADGNGNTDLIVGLQPGTTPGSAGSCYIPPGFSANALSATCQFGLAGAVANG